MDQEKKKKGLGSQWDNPFPVERTSQNQSRSGRGAVEQNTRIESHCLQPSHVNLLTSFGLSFEDLEELSQYPDDQLTPENIPVLLQKIQKSKLAPKVRTLSSKSTEKESVSSGDGPGPTEKKKVIDYGHKSKYGYDEDPMEMNASFVATGDGMKGFQTQQSASAAASRFISNPKNPTKELIREMRSRARRPNLQVVPRANPAKKVPLAELGVPARVPPAMPPAEPSAPPVTPPVLSPAVNQPSFVPELLELLRRHGRSKHTPRAGPPNRPCRTMAGQKSFWKEAEEPFKSPFGVVKASWLPDFSQTNKQEKKLPTSPQMCDYYAVTPRVFPHTCSLCNEDCIDKKDWIQHQTTILHSQNCRRLLQQYPDWAPENPSSPKRHEGDRQERHESDWRSASPSPEHSRRSSSGHARHQTRSRSRSSECHWRGRPRSRSPRRLPSPRHRSRSPWQSLHSSRWSQRSSSKERRYESRCCSVSPSPEHSRRSTSGHARHWSRSGSSECHMTNQPRSQSPRCFPSPRHRSRSQSRSPWSSLPSSRWSQRSSSKDRRQCCSASPSPEHSRHSTSGHARHWTWSRSRSPECHMTNQPRSPRCLPSPRHQSRSQSRSPRQSLPSSRWSRRSSSKERRYESRCCSANPSPEHSRHSTSGHARHWLQSRSSECHMTNQPRSQSPRRLPSPRHWSRSQSRSPRQSLPSCRWSRRSSSKERRRYESRCCSASSSPEHSRHSTSGHARYWTWSRSGSSECHMTNQPRSPSPRRLPSPRPRSRSQSRSPRQSLPSSRWSQRSSSKERRTHESRCCSASPSPEHPRYSTSGHARYRTQSRSRSSERHRRSRPRSRSPRHHPSPRHWSRSPRRSLHSSRLSQSSTSKEKKSGSSTRSTEGQRAKIPCSKKEYDERKPTHSSSDCRKRRRDDLKRTREDTPHKKLSADETGSQEQARDKLVPEGRSRVELGRSALASLTEESVLRAMAQLQAQGAAGGTLSQGMNSTLATNTSAVSSDLMSMIQQVATQIITTVLDSRGASTTRASTSVRDLNPPKVKPVIRKTKGPSPQRGTAKGSKGPSAQRGSAKGSKGPSAQRGTAKGTKGQSAQRGSAKGSKGPSAQQGSAKNTKTPTPQQGTELLELVPGSVCPGSGEAALSSHPVSIKAGTSGVTSPSPQPGTAGPCEAENKEVEQELIVSIPLSLVCLPGEAAVSSQPVSIKAEPTDAASPSPQQGTSGPCKAENKEVEQEMVLGSIPPGPGEAALSSHPVSIKAETSGVASPSPQPGTSGPCKAENKEVEQEMVLGSVPPGPGEASVSIKAETSGVASPSPQPGMPGPCEAENKNVKQELVAGSIPPCPGNPKHTSKQRVWICGQSVVVSAEKQASGTGAGSQLGLEESLVLEWHGQEDLTWTQLVPMLQSLAAQGPAPDVLVLHLGEKDLKSTHEAQLSCTIRKELQLVKELFPRVRILWSNLLLRRRSSGSRVINQARTGLNLEMGPFVATLGGAVIEHGAILHTTPGFYVGRDNLSRCGLDLFLEDVKNGILAHLHS